ncbi:hypothetical protein [Pseudomonas sp. UBA7530]|uniref:hypothetical protein n=1 Tax=Pseudomonas sp. UBA7530 TaxID=1947341 RepID=UPI0018D5BE96|nr:MULTISPECIES: hypothetical protein [Pseudomonas]MBH3337500.1 hypothetical protein [Pseudomonas mendocina]
MLINSFNLILLALISALAGMLMALSAIGFTPFDTYLLIACTIGSIAGSFAQAISATIQPDGPPNREGILKRASPELSKARLAWLTMRCMLGAILGFVFGLYFVGALHQTSAVFAKIWALSFVVGYAAPKIWQTKERSFLAQFQQDAAEK